MAQIMIKRQMKALFGVGNSNNDSLSPTEEEACSATKCQAKSLDSSPSLVGKKRKYASLDDSTDDESSSLPSLELEDALSEVDSDSVCDSSETKDCCNNTDERDQKRRKNLQEFPSDLIVVLDMDECLIHFKAQQEDEGKENNGVQENCNKKREKQEQQEQVNANKNNKNDPSILHVNQHQVLLRPGLVEFLKFVTTRFQTHIFTAGTQEYADAILDQLSQLVLKDSAKGEDIFCKRWYRDDCDTIDILNPLNGSWIDSIYVKPLSKVAQWAGRASDDLSRIVHIDDQPKNFLLNYDNGIIVKEWRGDCVQDQILSNVSKVLEKIDAKQDVRPHLMGESYLALKDHLDLLHLFPHRRTKGIGSTLLA